jgi:hypothetical protein
MKLLIAGDSFAANWSVKHKEMLGWPNLLAGKHSVTNVAQAGVSEYRIYKQLVSCQRLNEFDAIIVCHTSPYRLVTRQHPVHYKDTLRPSADLIQSDIEYHAKWHDFITNPALAAAKGYFQHHYDIEYHEDIYGMIHKQINSLLENLPTVFVQTILEPRALAHPDSVDISGLEIDSNSANHLNSVDNFMVHTMIEDKLIEIGTRS